MGEEAKRILQGAADFIPEMEEILSDSDELASVLDEMGELSPERRTAHEKIRARLTKYKGVLQSRGYTPKPRT